MALLLILMLFTYVVHISPQKSCDKIFKDASFECQFTYDGIRPSMDCESSESDPHQNYPKDNFYILKLFWNTLNTSDSNKMFKSLMKEALTPESNIYSCKRLLKNHVSFDFTTLETFCEKFSFCSKKISKLLKPKYVRRVEIQNTRSDLIFNIFNEFSELIEIQIYNNQNLNISKLNISKFDSLEILNLTENNIDFLPSDVFSNLENLEELDLSRNSIRFISHSHFASLYNLKFLNLTSNFIDQISPDAFAKNRLLKSIFLSTNQLTSIDEKLFQFNDYIAQLDLSFNNLGTLPKGLNILHKLEDFSCVRCNLTELPLPCFTDSATLLHVDFSHNDIKTVPYDYFKQTPVLTLVDFAENKLSEMPEFRNKTFLRILRLGGNSITAFSETLNVQAPHLMDLNMTGNKIEVLADAHVKGFADLERLDLTNNRITFVQLGIDIPIYIRILHLQYNKITNIDIQWRNLLYLEIIDVDYNQLTHISPPPCIPSIKQTITFSFRYNNISKLDMRTLLDDEKRIHGDTTSMAGCYFNGLSKNFIDVTGNPLICDCDLYPLYKYLKNKRRSNLDTFLSEDKLTCSGPPLLQNESIISLPEDDFSCSVLSDCPQPCKCGIRGKDNQIFVNCTFLGLTYIPNKVPTGATVLYLNQNNLKSLSSLNSECWSNLTELHADQNKLETLTEWDIPPHLRFLSLRKNRLDTIPQTLLNFIGNQSDFSLFFGGNDRNCKCSTKTLKAFINEHFNFIKDANDIECEIANNGSTSHLALHTVPDAILCAKSFVPSADPTLIIVVLCSGFGSFIMLLLIYYKHRQLILSFLYIHFNELFHTCFEENDIDSDKTFDAFVAYSSTDRHIVMELLKGLEEKEPHFQLCIHERDWLPGRFISDNIMSSVQSSKRTIIVLSNTFIASPWFTLELRAAIFKVSGDKRNKLIVILADKSTSLDGIDTEIRHVISKRTYLVWGERWFWEKLRYVMPRKSCLETNQCQNCDEHADSRSDAQLLGYNPEI